MYESHLIICCIHVITWPLWQSCTSILQLTVEPCLLQSMNPYCSLTPTQQKVQWWCSSVSQGLSQREWWQLCVGIMASGYPILEMSPAAPDPHRHPHRHSQRYLHKYQHLRWLLLLLDQVNKYYDHFIYACIVHELKPTPIITHSKLGMGPLKTRLQGTVLLHCYATLNLF